MNQYTCGSGAYPKTYLSEFMLGESFIRLPLRRSTCQYMYNWTVLCLCCVVLPVVIIIFDLFSGPPHRFRNTCLTYVASIIILNTCNAYQEFATRDYNEYFSSLNHFPTCVQHGWYLNKVHTQSRHVMKIYRKDPFNRITQLIYSFRLSKQGKSKKWGLH